MAKWSSCWGESVVDRGYLPKAKRARRLKNSQALRKQMTVTTQNIDLSLINEKDENYLIDPFLRPPVCLILIVAAATALLIGWSRKTNFS